MDLIKKINVPMVLLCLLSVATLASGEAYAIALVSLGLTALYGYSMYLKTRQIKSLDEQVKQELEAIKSQMTGIAVKNNIKPMPGPTQRFF
jgi:hypothetical protein